MKRIKQDYGWSWEKKMRNGCFFSAELLTQLEKYVFLAMIFLLIWTFVQLKCLAVLRNKTFEMSGTEPLMKVCLGRKIRLQSSGLFFSDNIMVFDFLHFVFFQVQYIIAGSITYKDCKVISTYFFAEVITWKENKEFGTICFEVRIPMK